jgi:hypothetical protein
MLGMQDEYDWLKSKSVQQPLHIKSGCIGIISSQNEETAVPCPYNIIFGRETAVPSPLYHSGVTGIDIRTWLHPIAQS